MEVVVVANIASPGVEQDGSSVDDSDLVIRQRHLLLELVRQPDIILISNRFDEFHDWAFADPLVGAELSHYRLYASDGETRGETFLYARADLIPLRPGFTQDSAEGSAQ